MNIKRMFVAGLIIALSVGITSCKPRVNTAVTPSPGETVLWKSHDKRPEWVQIQQADQGSFYYATGLSDRFTTELDAREHAMLKARQAVADYVLGFVETEYKESRSRANNAGGGADVQVEGQNVLRSAAQVAVTQVRPKEWYLEKVKTENGKVLWSAIVLVEAPREVIQREIARVTHALKILEEQDTTFPIKLTAKPLSETSGAKF